MSQRQGWFLSLGIAVMILAGAEGYARMRFPKAGLFTGYYRHWEFEWKVRQFESWRREGAPSIPQVVLIGDSRIYSGIDPETLEQSYERRWNQKIRAFNLAVDGLSVDGIRTTLLPLFTASEKPDCVILGLSSLSLRNMGSWKEMYLEAPAAKPWHPSSLLLRYSWLYASRKALHQKILFFGDPNIPEPIWVPPEGVSLQGYKALVPDPEHPAVKGIKQFFENGLSSPEQLPAKPDPVYFDEKRFARLEDLLTRFRRKKIPVVIVVTPAVLYPYPYNLREQELFRGKLAVLKTQGAEILDFQDDPAFQRSDYFADVYHLSAAGARAFSAGLSRALDFKAKTPVGRDSP